MPESVAIMLIDQDQEARYHVRNLLKRSAVAIAGEAGLGTEAISAAVDATPDVLLCAMNEPVTRPLQTIEALQRALPETPLIVYSRQPSIGLARQAMLAGARELLAEPLSADAIVGAVNSVLGASERSRLGNPSASALGMAGTVIAVFSAKGGVGKTTFASNLAASLAAETGCSVVLIDGDTSFGDSMVALDLQATTDLIDAIAGIERGDVKALEQSLVIHSSGARVLPPPRNALDWNRVEPGQFRSVIELAARAHDYIVIDLAASAHHVSVEALHDAALIFWLVTPDVYTISDNMRALELMKTVPIDTAKVRFVLNQTSPNGDVPVETIETALQQQVYWRIPYDPQLHELTQLGRTVNEWGEGQGAARSITGLARVVAGAPEERPRSNGRGPRRLLSALVRS